jgi:hypothetical protein
VHLPCIVNRDGFEARVLDLWVTTRVPLTRANLQVATGATRRQLERWLDDMLLDGVVDVDNDTDGELLYSVRGATRPRTGTTSVADVVKLARLQGEVAPRGAVSSALAMLPRPDSLVVAKPGHKSIVASAGLSFFLGPIGWLYAAPLREAVPAAVLFVLLYKLLPMILFAPLLGILLPASALAGAAYAWAHNQTGDRSSIKDAARGLGKRDRSE